MKAPPTRAAICMRTDVTRRHKAAQQRELYITSTLLESTYRISIVGLYLYLHNEPTYFKYTIRHGHWNMTGYSGPKAEGYAQGPKQPVDAPSSCLIVFQTYHTAEARRSTHAQPAPYNMRKSPFNKACCSIDHGAWLFVLGRLS